MADSSPPLRCGSVGHDEKGDSDWCEDTKPHNLAQNQSFAIFYISIVARFIRLAPIGCILRSMREVRATSIRSGAANPPAFDAEAAGTAESTGLLCYARLCRGGPPPSLPLALWSSATERPHHRGVRKNPPDNWNNYVAGQPSGRGPGGGRENPRTKGTIMLRGSAGGGRSNELLKGYGAAGFPARQVASGKRPGCEKGLSIPPRLSDRVDGASGGRAGRPEWWRGA